VRDIRDIIEPLFQAVPHGVPHGVKHELGVYKELITLGCEVAFYPKAVHEVDNMFDSVFTAVHLINFHLRRRYRRLAQVDWRLKVSGNHWPNAVRLADEDCGGPEDENDCLI
jgi:hypothetical protein